MTFPIDPLTAREIDTRTGRPTGRGPLMIPRTASRIDPQTTQKVARTTASRINRRTGNDPTAVVSQSIGPSTAGHTTTGTEFSGSDAGNGSKSTTASGSTTTVVAGGTYVTGCCGTRAIPSEPTGRLPIGSAV